MSEVVEVVNSGGAPVAMYMLSGSHSERSGSQELKEYMLKAGVYAAEAEAEAENAEAWAKGTRNGEDVQSTDPTYQNNAKYYADLAMQRVLNDYIDDTAGDGDTTLVWSADKLYGLFAAILSGLEADSAYHLGFYKDSDGDFCLASAG